MLTRDAKYGWEIAHEGSTPHKARVIAWDIQGPWPIAAHSTEAEAPAVLRFKESGIGKDDYTLRDAPAPKASGTDWIVRFAERGRPYAMAFATHDEAKKWLSERSGIWQEVAIIRVPWTEGMGLEAQSRKGNSRLEIVPLASALTPEGE